MFLLLTSCCRHSEVPNPNPATLEGGVNEVQVTMWNPNNNQQVYSSQAININGDWSLNKKLKKNNLRSTVSIYYPSSLTRSNHYALLLHSYQKPVYYGYAENTFPKNIELKRVQGQLNLEIDLSDFPDESILEDISLAPLFGYGWINLVTGAFQPMEGQYSDQLVVRRIFDKSISSLKDNILMTSFYFIPAQKQSLTLTITINSREYIATIKPRRIIANGDYKYHIKLFYKNSPVVISDEEKKLGCRDNMNVSNEINHNYQYTSTDDYNKSISNCSGVVFSFWVDNLSDKIKELEYKMLILDDQNKVVSQSPIYGGVVINPYSYEGFGVPLYIDAPKAGYYTYQLLLREKGKDTFFEPAQRDDDTPTDKVISINHKEHLFCTRFQLDQNINTPSASIAKRKFNELYHATVTINNYSSEDKSLIVRLYHRRNPLEQHSNLDPSLVNIDSWEDIIAEQTTSIPGKSSRTLQIPYQFKIKRPLVNRFPAYVCATIQENNGIERPLQRDGNLLYKLTCKEANPNSRINALAVYNLSYVSVE